MNTIEIEVEPEASPTDIQRIKNLMAGLPEDISHRDGSYNKGNIYFMPLGFTATDMHAIANHMARREGASIKARFNKNIIGPRDAIKELANTFPVLAECPQWFGPEASWTPDFVAALDRRFSHCSAGEHACAFILSVWNPNTKWSHKFNLMDAMSNWDITHRTAFINWALDPWWP